jgi:hypothetical protein
MSILVDTKYLSLISSKLLNFKKKTGTLWNFRCPYCLDSKKKESKSRGYVYRKNNDLFFKCHNCNKGTTFPNFIKFLDDVLYKEYVMERFIGGDTHPNHNYKKPELLSSNTKEKFIKRSKLYDIELESISDLPEGHYAKEYIKDRMIPNFHWNKLFFAPDFKEFSMTINPEKSKNLKRDDPRIVIPFFDENYEFIAFQGRSLLDSQVKYITIKTYEEAPKIFGLERLSLNNKIWIFEGPLDSLFIENSLATAGSDLKVLLTKFPQGIYVFDNEPDNKQIIQNMEYVIDSGSQIVIWNKDNKYKDVNDMVLVGLDVRNMLEECVYTDLEAMFRFNEWRKV